MMATGGKNHYKNQLLDIKVVVILRKIVTYKICDLWCAVLLGTNLSATKEGTKNN